VLKSGSGIGRSKPKAKSFDETDLTFGDEMRCTNSSPQGSRCAGYICPPDDQTNHK
jgi:hypothetical protein